MLIKSGFEVVSHIPNHPTDELKKEPMFYRASRDYAYEKGGDIMKNFIDHLPEEWDDLDSDDILIDSRTHMLMETWIPCIGGFHMDAIRRGENGQPDFNEPGDAEHVIVWIGDDVSPTQMLTGALNIDLPEELDRPVWSYFDDEVKKQMQIQESVKQHAIERGLPNAGYDEDELRIFTTKCGDMIKFGFGGLHRGTPSKGSGWRHFIRASVRTGFKPENEIRTQVQAYIPDASYGW